MGLSGAHLSVQKEAFVTRGIARSPTEEPGMYFGQIPDRFF
jgi:hypothetical protein